jgi:hypothetical protein
LDCEGGGGHRLFAVETIIRGRGRGVPPLVDTSEIDHHGVHLVCIDGDAIPCHAVASLDKVASDLPVGHAAHELLPRGLAVRAELHTRLSGVVKEFIVANPEGSVPSLVGCPTVESGEGGGHVVVCCVDVISLQGQGRMCCSMVDSASAVTVLAGVLV